MSARDELTARMADVVGQLLRGHTPEGFDELRARHTARILAMKRVTAMVHLRPEIVLLPDWRERAIEFALATPSGRGAPWDTEMFAEWVRDHPLDGDADWLILDDVCGGRRRAARVQIGGRRHLVWRRSTRHGGRVQSWPPVEWASRSAST